jgi:tRNA1Val (adenine37-N6)-methyltransferase
MSNSYFQFKQFTVQQEQCAMKVCTDACLFGAWAADLLQQKKVNTILDIGTGTGLLSLMVAQKTGAAIDAVEVDKNAFQQAKDNFSTSHWAEKLTTINSDITVFNTAKKYDCIISNPPFFEDDLRSPHNNKNAAKHDTSLTFQVLLQQVTRLLKEDGGFAVLLPYHRVEYFISEGVKQGLFCNEKVLVKQTTKHNYFRGMLLFSANKIEAVTKEITIKDDSGKYTSEFISLLKEYYLYL